MFIIFEIFLTLCLDVEKDKTCLVGSYNSYFQENIEY